MTTVGESSCGAGVSKSKPAPLSGTVLAFDYGEKRLGVAVGEIALALAHPLCTIAEEATDLRFRKIGELLAEWRPTHFVVGLPFHADGTPHQVTELEKRFARRLAGRYGLPVIMCDERYTSLHAEAELREMGISTRKQRPILDQVAAQKILQTYLDNPQAYEPI